MPYGWAMAGAQGISYGIVAAHQAKRARKAQAGLIADLQKQKREISTGGMDPGQMRTLQTAGALQQQATQAGVAEEAARGTGGRGLTSTQLGQLASASAMGTAAQQQALDQASAMEAARNAGERRAMQAQITQAKYQLDAMPTAFNAFGETLIKTSGDYAGQQASGMGIGSLGQQQQGQGAQNQAVMAQTPQYPASGYDTYMSTGGTGGTFGSTSGGQAWGATNNPYSFGG